jgi:hypothetical protein
VLEATPSVFGIMKEILCYKNKDYCLLRCDAIWYKAMRLHSHTSQKIVITIFTVLRTAISTSSSLLPFKAFKAKGIDVTWN